MKRINIDSQKHGLVWLDKKNQAEVDAYLAEIEQTQHWGKPAYTEIIPAKDAVLDENGVELEPAMPEQVIEHPAEYTVEVIDITAEVAEAKEVAKYEARIAFFTKLMAKLAAKQKTLLETGELTIQQALANKASLAPVKDFGIEGSLSFALAALIDAEIVVVDKAPFVAEIQAYLASEG